jgi:DNA-binding NarL/FixJ family response regulator
MTIRVNTPAGKRVLIAEDEPMIAMDHAALLVRAGAAIVATCATVKGAVDCVGEMAIDVAVIDFMLADGNSQPLQAALNRKHIPFVVVSAYPRPLVRTEPDQEIPQKPVTHDLLCGHVEAACKLAA